MRTFVKTILALTAATFAVAARADAPDPYDLGNNLSAYSFQSEYHYERLSQAPSLRYTFENVWYADLAAYCAATGGTPGQGCMFEDGDCILATSPLAAAAPKRIDVEMTYAGHTQVETTHPGVHQNDPVFQLIVSYKQDGEAYSRTKTIVFANYNEQTTVDLGQGKYRIVARTIDPDSHTIYVTGGHMSILPALPGKDVHDLEVKVCRNGSRFLRVKDITVKIQN